MQQQNDVGRTVKERQELLPRHRENKLKMQIGQCYFFDVVNHKNYYYTTLNRLLNYNLNRRLIINPEWMLFRWLLI